MCNSNDKLEVTAKDLRDVVILALMGKNPANGMKLKPRNKRIAAARAKLEEYLDKING